VVIKAPAKINVTLRILSKRADGYHEISSLMRAVRLYDEVEIIARECAGAASGPPEIITRSNEEGLPDGPDNLAWCAADLMLGMYPGHFGQIDIYLKKSIPVAAGLAGGSSDAAAVLLYLSKELAPGAELSDIAARGAKLGMDVPFCVYACAAANPELGYEGAGIALAGGAGDILTPVSHQEKEWVVLVKPMVSVPTKQVYALYDEWKSETVYSENDLEGPCREAWPVVAESLNTLKKICAEECPEEIKVQLCGSGPTVFAYFEGPGKKTEARRVYDRAKCAFPDMFVCLTETL